MNPPTTPRTKLCGQDGARALVLVLGVALADCSSRSTHTVSEPDAGNSGAGSGGGSGAGTGGSGAGGSSTGGSGTGGSGTGGAAGQDGSGGAAGSTGVMDCGEYAEAICGRLAACFPYIMQTSWGSVELCEAANQRTCEGARDAPGSIDPVAGEACLTATRALGCSDLFGNGVEECQFRGSLPLGAGCVFSNQCQSGACHNDAPDSFCGRCASRVAEGGDCTNAPCDYGFSCGLNLTCRRLGKLGDACDVAQTPCNLAYYCKNGVCTDPLPLGAGCDVTESACSILAGHICLTYLSGSASCAAIILSPIDSACGQVDEEFWQCAGDANCVQPSGRCRPRPVAGETCEISTTSCAQPELCVGGVCMVPDPAGCTD